LGRRALDLDAAIRARLQEAIEEILIEELDAALGAAKHERGTERCGYRNGVRGRTLTCQAGTATVAVPRGRIFRRGGSEPRVPLALALVYLYRCPYRFHSNAPRDVAHPAAAGRSRATAPGTASREPAPVGG
jgi:hypothetical protein